MYLAKSVILIKNTSPKYNIFPPNLINLKMTQNMKLTFNPLNINEQFPGEIDARRMKVYPVMKQAKREGKYVSLVRDKLFVDGEQFMMMENKN